MLLSDFDDAHDYQRRRYQRVNDEQVCDCHIKQEQPQSQRELWATLP